MNIFILGGGRVGFHLAHMLSEEQYDVTVIEADAERHEQIDMALNARVVSGDGTSALLLQSLQAGEADLFIACTGSDETNLIAAAAAVVHCAFDACPHHPAMDVHVDAGIEFQGDVALLAGHDP